MQNILVVSGHTDLNRALKSADSANTGEKL